ncbi:MAG: membrane protein insertion efficiency factor YidD [Phycisphaerales bacterium]|nr:membrane protein insertion efficiency factor YidD [Phycisphaerales bacterium]
MTTRVQATRGKRAATAPFVWAIRAYQLTLGHFIGGRCRFHPSCSNYAIDAYRLHGPIRGTRLTIARLLRCHPWGGSGVDPVPGSEPENPPPSPLHPIESGPPADPPSQS